MKPVLRITLLLVLAAVLAALLVPNTTLASLRSAYPWLGELGSRLDSLSPWGVDLDHLLAFGALGVATGLALPTARLRQVAVGMLALACATELLQVWVPGRTARLADVVGDVAGGLAGWACIWLLRQLGRALLGARRPPGSTGRVRP